MRASTLTHAHARSESLKLFFDGVSGATNVRPTTWAVSLSWIKHSVGLVLQKVTCGSQWLKKEIGAVWLSKKKKKKRQKNSFPAITPTNQVRFIADEIKKWLWTIEFKKVICLSVLTGGIFFLSRWRDSLWSHDRFARLFSDPREKKKNHRPRHETVFVGTELRHPIFFEKEGTADADSLSSVEYKGGSRLVGCHQALHYDCRYES